MNLSYQYRFIKSPAHPLSCKACSSFLPLISSITLSSSFSTSHFSLLTFTVGMILSNLSAQQNMIGFLKLLCSLCDTPKELASLVLRRCGEHIESMFSGVEAT